MTPSLRRKLEALAERHEEVGRLLADPGVLADNARFRALSKEYAQLEPVAAGLAQYQQARRDLEAAEAMRADPELRELAEDEIPAAQSRLARRRHRRGQFGSHPFPNALCMCTMRAPLRRLDAERGARNVVVPEGLDESGSCCRMRGPVVGNGFGAAGKSRNGLLTKREDLLE